tara:strand:- start:882 stop:1148 length:267 start_codon:yes stop_codon:yes gene_type:complete
MKPISLKPKEIDIVVSSLEQALLFWNERIALEELPPDFDHQLAASLYDDIFLTLLKFSEMQEEMDTELSSEDIPLPNNVLKFPDTNND